MANRALAKGAWVVTGAASGIGQQFASYLARRGDAVAAWDRDATGLERTRELCAPGRLDSQQVDVSVAADVERAAAASRAALGPLAHVVHCAGILRMAPVEAMAVEDFRAMIDVNYLGSVHVAKALLPDLRTATSGGRAVLMFVASIAGLRAAPELAGYSASKHAVVALAQALRDELHGSGIDVRALCPPPVDTPMLHDQPRIPPIYRVAPAIAPDVVVSAAMRALEARDELVVLVDARSRVLAGAYRLVPWVVDRVVQRTIRQSP